MAVLTKYTDGHVITHKDYPDLYSYEIIHENEDEVNSIYAKNTFYFGSSIKKLFYQGAFYKLIIKNQKYYARFSASKKEGYTALINSYY